jgi:hypothetical protein
MRSSHQGAVVLASGKNRSDDASDHGAEGEVQSQTSALEGLSVAALRKSWKHHFGNEAPPVRSADILRRLLAWRIQADDIGGLDRVSAGALDKIGEALQRDGSYEPKIRRGFSEGMVLTREWKGVVHKVTVAADGFQHLGKLYKSLSNIARTITGTRWSGPRFFGLEQNERRPPKGATNRKALAR